MKNIDELKKLWGGRKILCAVSGGADSMCMLHALRSAGAEVYAAHYEHGIRGAESLRDALFVQSYCQSENIPFVMARGNVPQYAKAHSMGTEEAARLLRYEFLEQKREELGCEFIATAHNADDNAETVLMNLIRGSGAKGLSGIPRMRGSIIRPLIQWSRRDVEQYLALGFIPHVEDSTNQSDDYTRNLLRHRIIPQILEINPNFSEAAARTAELMRRDEQMLAGFAALMLKESPMESGLDLYSFNRMHVSVTTRMLRQILGNIPMDNIDEIIVFARKPGYGRLSVPGHTVTKDTGRLYFDLKESAPLPDRVLEIGTELDLPEAGLRLKSEIVEYNGEVHDLFKTSYLKYEIIGTDILVGARREGDSLRPAGRGLSKKLKSLFMEKSVPVHKRDIVPVIRDEKGILMVRGIATDQRCTAKIGEKALKISFEEIKTDA